MKGQKNQKKVSLAKQLGKEEYNKRSRYEKNFKFKKRLQNEPRFGPSSIIETPDRRLLIVQEKRANNKKHIDDVKVIQSNLDNHVEAGVKVIEQLQTHDKTDLVQKFIQQMQTSRKVEQ